MKLDFYKARAMSMVRMWLRRAIGRGEPPVPEQPSFLGPAKHSESVQPPATDVAHHVTLDEILCVVEVDRAEFLIEDLFKRRFGASAAPTDPRHFVAFYKPAQNTFIPIGYVHQTPWEGCHMCGGLVMDERLYRRINAAHRRVIRESGGIAEILLRESFARIKPMSLAIWGHVGDKQSEVVTLRVGFQRTSDPHVMVIWNSELSEVEKQRWLAKVIGLGPF